MRPLAIGLGGLFAAAFACGPAGALDSQAPAASRFDIAFGVGLTSDYIARGISQTNSGAAVQGFVEVDFSRLYLGAWTSNVNFGGAVDQEVDLAVGWRPNIGKFAFDLGYVDYIYANGIAGSAFGEVYAGFTVPVTDKVTIGTKASFASSYAASNTSATYVEATADVKLPNGFGISGALGYQQFDPAYGQSYINGNIGIYWSLNKSAKIDLRYSTTNLSQADCANLMSIGTECGAKVLVGLTISGAASDFAKN